MKNKLFLAAMLLVMAAALTACGGAKDQTPAQPSAQPSAPTQSQQNTETPSVETGYVFEVNGVSLSPDMNIDEVLNALGEPKSVFEEPSCAAQGTSYLYTFSGYEICTYPAGERNLIGYILFHDDTVATAEGIDLSSSKADVLATYGSDCEDEGNRLVYRKGGMNLNFFYQDERIISIEYDSDILG